MKKGYIFVILLVIIAGFYLSFSKPSDPIGHEVELAMFGNKGLLYVPFIKELEKGVTISAQVGGEKISSEIRTMPRTDWRTSIPVTVSDSLKEGTEIVISINSVNYERTITKITRETDDLLDLDTVTKHEESMKGWGGLAYAEEEPVTEAYRPGVPDLGQRIAECAPTSAANSLMSLMGENGKDLPNPTELVDELKGDMDWTAADGVLPPNFVEGKNKWAARHGLPIRTEIVGDQHGRGSLEGIMDALANGDAAAEVRIKFANAQGKATGGHMVTVVGVHTDGGQTFIDINDPRTPAGTDSYEVNGNVIEGYPYDGMAIVSWGFVQRWEGNPTGVDLEPMTNEEIKGIQEAISQKEKIKVIIYGKYKIPLSEVHIGKGEHCDSAEKQYPHWHANNGSAKALDGTVIPDPGECGYGKATNVKVEEVEI